MAAFWARREDQIAFEEKKRGQQEGSGFRVAGRGLLMVKKKIVPWATIMQDSDGELLVPNVFLAPIHEPTFVSFPLTVLYRKSVRDHPA